jgi:hypothetical protein
VTPTITAAERRARVVARHHLAGDAPDVDTAVDDLVAMHASDPATPHLGVAVRTGDGTDAAGDPMLGDRGLADALFERRVLWRRHAMRRTLFVIPAHRAGTVHAAVGREVALRERRKLEAWVAAERPMRAATRLLTEAESTMLAAFGDGEWATRELVARFPVLATSIPVGSGAWASRVSLGARLLLVLAAEGRLVRTRPAGSWRSSQYRWARADAWFADPPDDPPADEARTALAGRYLERFGPVTLADLRWWAGWTAAQARCALRDIDAVEVRLEGSDEPGFLLPGDRDGPGTQDVASSVALLPALDPTPMGWALRDWYVAGHAPELFDRNGNVGPTVWVDGRIVGGWGQRADGTVEARLLEPVSSELAERVDARVAAMQAWLGDTVVQPRFRTPLERAIHASG